MLLEPAYAQFRDQTRFWIQRVAVPLLMVVGLFGNSITVIIMTRRRMRSTTNLYLAALAFVDMLYLVLTFVLGLSHYPNMAAPQYYYYWRLRPFLMMLTDACSNTSVWLTVSFTIERYIAVKYPMKGKVWCTEARAKLLILLVFLTGILFAAPVPLEWQVVRRTLGANKGGQQTGNKFDNTTLKTADGRRPTQEEAAPFILALDYSDFGRNETFKTIYYRSVAVIFYFVPLLLLMLFNGFLIKSVHQSQKERTKMTRRGANLSSNVAADLEQARHSSSNLNGARDLLLADQLKNKAAADEPRTKAPLTCAGRQDNAPAAKSNTKFLIQAHISQTPAARPNHRPAPVDLERKLAPPNQGAAGGARDAAIESGGSAKLKRSAAGGVAPSPSANQQSSSSTHERRITIMLIAVVILFLVCQIPSAAMLLYTSVREMEPNTNEQALVLAFGNIFNFLMAVNAAGNFILYSFLSKKYRNTFVILFCTCPCSAERQQAGARPEQAGAKYRASSSSHQQLSGDKRQTLV